MEQEKENEEMALEAPNNNNQEEIGQVKTLNHHSLYYTFTQRYFSSYQSENLFLHMHSNGLIVIAVKLEGLPSKPIKLIDVFEVNEVKGKRKRGGSRVRKETVLMEIQCEKGQIERVRAGVDGTILEKNSNISIDNLGKSNGYVAIIMPLKNMKLDQVKFKEVALPTD